MRLSCLRGLSAILSAFVLIACDRGNSPSETKAPVPQELGSGAALAATMPDTSSQPSGQPSGDVGESIGGTILETMDSGGYTYMRLGTPSGEVWAAVTQTAVRTGDSAMVVNAMLMTGFESSTLKRKFDAIYFGNLAASAPGGSAAAVNPAASSVSVAEAHSGSSKTGKMTFDVPIAKFDGAEARTIEEIHVQKAELTGKPVSVRGKVTKVTEGVLGKTWIHLQDGSGSAEAGNFDLTVTTDGKASEGDVIVASGVLATDKDLGHGYVYAVLLENATLFAEAPAGESKAPTAP